MDIETLLDGIFGEYTEKCIKEGKLTQEIQTRLELVREQAETALKDATDDFIGRPNTDATRMAMRDAVYRTLSQFHDLDQFLDTDIRVDNITSDGSNITMDISYSPKYPISSGLVIELDGGFASGLTGPNILSNI